MSKSVRKYSLLENILFPPTSLNHKKLAKIVSGKTILITGASFGIGESSSLLLGGYDCKLILIGRTEVKLKAVQTTVKKLGGKAEIFTCDLRKDDEIQALIKFLKQQDRLDIFINNAGKSIRRSLEESLDRYHDFNRTMAINYEAPVKLCLAIIPIMKKHSGHIINVSAINVLMNPAPKWGAYQASKSAFDQWFRSFHAEIESMNIATTSIYLPLVKTRMIEPTKAYDKMPAMKPEHVASIISKSILTKRRVHKPWWTFWGELGSLLFRKSMNAVLRSKVK